MNVLLKDFVFVFLFSNPAVSKKRRLRKLGEMAGATAVTPTVDEPWRAATPPADEHRAEEEVEEVVLSPVRTATPPIQQEAAADEAATEAAGAPERPDQARAQEATVEPLRRRRPPQGG